MRAKKEKLTENQLKDAMYVGKGNQNHGKGGRQDVLIAKCNSFNFNNFEVFNIAGLAISPEITLGYLENII